MCASGHPGVVVQLHMRFQCSAVHCKQMGDEIWSMLRGARTLLRTPIKSKHIVVQTGFINIRTFQGESSLKQMHPYPSVLPTCASP